jgi:hypothetical protein
MRSTCRYTIHLCVPSVCCVCVSVCGDVRLCCGGLKLYVCICVFCAKMDDGRQQTNKHRLHLKRTPRYRIVGTHHPLRVRLSHCRLCRVCVCVRVVCVCVCVRVVCVCACVCTSKASLLSLLFLVLCLSFPLSLDLHLESREVCMSKIIRRYHCVEIMAGDVWRHILLTATEKDRDREK